MEKATFAIDVQPAARPAAHGNDDITYTLCANPGQTLQPLAKVASGGELSRVSLAIEVACLDETPTPPPTIIFDEIDTGIGGEIADTVGRLLHTLGQSRQVLCITHLPQVAAYADAHYRIENTATAKKPKPALPRWTTPRASPKSRACSAAPTATPAANTRAACWHAKPA